MRKFLGQSEKPDADGMVWPLSGTPALGKSKKHDTDVAVDRLAIRPGILQRLTESVETALTPAGGTLRIERAIAPWTNTSGADCFPRLLEALAQARGFSVTAPWRELPAAVKEFVRRAADGAEHRFTGYLRDTACGACDGTRLTPAARAVTVNDRGITQASALPPDQLAELSGEPNLTGVERPLAEAVVAEVTAANLSGGEVRRVKPAAELRRRTRGRGLDVLVKDTPEPVAARPTSRTGRFPHPLPEAS
ncbi:hypothetical protein [Streptomyces acidiscabies]|uniref:hypothetical protein n=1 Tax=Streptomyces acidiscabies TaxID=42234 RepID=UPI0038F7B417